MIRPTHAEETDALVTMATATGAFKPIEIEALREVLDDYHATNIKNGHICRTYLDNGTPCGFAYYAPAAMTDRTWYLYWIVVASAHQGTGIGTRLLTAAESEVRRQLGRLFLIETSSLPLYAPARGFYVRNGFEQASLIADYYADGDDMVIYRKRCDEGRRS